MSGAPTDGTDCIGEDDPADLWFSWDYYTGPGPCAWWGKETVRRFYRLLAADPLQRGQNGTLAAMARASGGMLGGHPKQRRNARRRAMQRSRKRRSALVPW